MKSTLSSLLSGVTATPALVLTLLLAAPAAAVDSSSLASEIDAIVAPYVAARDFMGVVAVQRDGADPLIRAYGLASVELGVPHRPEGIFMIGSVSKQFTAVAVLLLAEEGRLATADRVSRHLPGFAHGEAITVEQLLTHTSGVADIYSLKRFGDTAGCGGTLAEVIDDLGRVELAFAPGSRFAYSNGGYAVLAAIIERVSGQGYGEFLRARVFGPLAMADSAHDRPGAAVTGRVPGYDPYGRAGLTPAIPVAPAFTVGSGSIWSSARDLLRFNAALHGGKVLQEVSYDKLTRDYGAGYGYGVSRFRRFGRETIGHDGRVAGYASDLARYLDDRTTVAILGNVQSAVRDEIRRQVAAAVFDEEVDPPSLPEYLAPGASAPPPLDELAGIYRFGPGFEVSVRVADGRLLARANQGGSSELVPLATGEWFSRMLRATVRFARDNQGAVDRLIWGPGDGAPVGRRVE